MEHFSGYRSILSGPAGGVVGYALTTMECQRVEGISPPLPVIGFDMGGTSTDVSRYSGQYSHVYDTGTLHAIQSSKIIIGF
jgi:5-oxoprolinase (ATP-hydrolysing)